MGITGFPIGDILNIFEGCFSAYIVKAFIIRGCSGGVIKDIKSGVLNGWKAQLLRVLQLVKLSSEKKETGCASP